MTTTKPDYELAREELTALYARTCPQGQVLLVGIATDHDNGKPWKHKLYCVTIGGEAFMWKAGMGVKEAPNCAEVLARCCSEGIGAERSFEQWCGDYDYDTDSRKALGVYLECQENGRKVLRVVKDRMVYEQLADLSNRL